MKSRYAPHVFPPCVIYALINPVDNSIFYVGKTTYKIRYRVNCHIQESNKRKSKKDIIINDLKNAGSRPKFKILQRRKYPEYKKMNMNLIEGFWIRKMVMAGHELTNTFLTTFDREYSKTKSRYLKINHQVTN